MAQRMNRAELLGKLAPLSADRLREVIWAVYWPGPTSVRERIEEALTPPAARPKSRPDAAIDSEALCAEVERFVSLARSGAYMGGTREVHRTERSKWRVTFRRLIDEATRAAASADDRGRSALEALIDLACECGDHDYFHSEDPVAAMRLVVSDKVKLLWLATIEREGFAAFARLAVLQLIRWERTFSWTRRGFHAICEQEVQLADVIAELVRSRGGLDHWTAFADVYIDALSTAPEPASGGWERDHALKRRSDRLSGFHELLLEHLAGTEAEDRLDRIANHPALAGPYLEFFKARLAHRRGDLEAARRLASACLVELPGQDGFLAFAKQIEAPLPPRAMRIAQEREQAAALPE